MTTPSLLMTYGMMLGTIAALGCNQTVQGNGQAQTEERPLSHFSKVDVEVPIAVKVTQGETYSVSLTADSNIAELIDAHVRGDTLVISSKGNFKPVSPVQVDVTLPELRGVEEAGSKRIVLSDSSFTKSTLTCQGHNC